MKSIVALIILGITTSCIACDALTKLATIPGPVGDAARDHLMYPPLPLELPHETNARRALLKFKDELVAKRTWTPQLELELLKQLANLAKAMSDRLAMEQQRVIIIER
jgi:hypothetical protein